MVPLTDLLRLHEGNEAERFLKPWWDVVIHYFILVLVMVAVVCGVVGLYAPAPACIPVVNCPALENSSPDKKEICAMVSNTSQKGEDAFDFVVKYSNRNFYDYINSECRENICWMVKFFPNVLIVMAGVCLVCSNVWFVLQSSTLGQFIGLLQDCYKYSADTPNSTEQSQKPEEGATQKDAVQEHAIKELAIQEHAIQRHAIQEQAIQKSPAQIGAAQKDAAQKYSAQEDFAQKGVAQKSPAQIGVAQKGVAQEGVAQEGVAQEGVAQKGVAQKGVAQKGDAQEGAAQEGDAQKDRKRLRRKMKKFRDDLKENNTCLKCSYFFVLVIQTLVVLVILCLLLWLIFNKMNRQYECKIDEIIQDLVYDTFICSYSISKFYQLCAGFFGCFIFLHLVISIFKLVQLLRIDFKRVNYKDKSQPPPLTLDESQTPLLILNESQPPPLTLSKSQPLPLSLDERMDLGFLLNLVKLSNLPYLEPFCVIYDES